MPSIYDHPEKLSVHVDLEKCSSKAAYEYFSRKFAETKSSHLSKVENAVFFPLLTCILDDNALNIEAEIYFSLIRGILLVS